MEKFKLQKNGQWSLEPLSKGKGDNEKDPLGVTSDKGKIKFDPHFGQKEFREYVKSRADHMTDKGLVAGDVDTWNWHWEPEYDTNKLAPIKKDAAGWIAWYDGELVEWQYNNGDARKGHFEKWAEHPAKKPIIVVEGSDGKDHVIDGHHRTAMAFKKKMKSIPIVYGRRKI